MEIFVISLSDSLCRREVIYNALTDIDFKFYNAENVSSNSNHFILDIYNKQKTKALKGYTLTDSELGCAASHINLWKKCINENKVFLIMEDNIVIHGDLINQLTNIEELTQQYGLVKLGTIFQHKAKDVQIIDSDYRLITQGKGGCGTFSYAISPETAKKYLLKIKGFFEPIDDFMDCEWRTGQTIYSYHPQIVSRSTTPSVIGKRKIKNSINYINRLNIEAYRFSKQLNQKTYNIRHK